MKENGQLQSALQAVLSGEKAREDMKSIVHFVSCAVKLNSNVCVVLFACTDVHPLISDLGNISEQQKRRLL